MLEDTNSLDSAQIKHFKAGIFKFLLVGIINLSSVNVVYIKDVNLWTF